VSRRTKEIGIRMAVGARSQQVLAMVLREGMGIVLVGIASGLGLAAGATRLVRHLLYGSAGGDAITYGAAGLLVAGVGLLACFIPARRAAGVEPVVALREG
jgi:putative ABC transport system permease protein